MATAPHTIENAELPRRLRTVAAFLADMQRALAPSLADDEPLDPSWQGGEPDYARDRLDCEYYEQVQR